MEKNNSIIDNIAIKVEGIREPVATYYGFLRKEMRTLSSMTNGLPIEYLPSPFEIADYYGISYQFEKMGGNMPSYLTRNPDVIHISDLYNEYNYEARVLCAHELGHYFLHEDQQSAMNNDCLNLYIPEENEKEYEANIFAILIMPQIMGGEAWENFSVSKLNRMVYEKTIK